MCSVTYASTYSRFDAGDGDAGIVYAVPDDHAMRCTASERLFWKSSDVGPS